MSRKNVFIVIGVVLAAAAVVGANLYFKKEKGLTVNTEVVKTRDLEAIVAASGKIQPKRLVQISADTPGRVVNLAVNEGDRIKKGQFLLQIDPRSLRTRVDSGVSPSNRSPLNTTAPGGVEETRSPNSSGSSVVRSSTGSSALRALTFVSTGR